LNGSCFSGFPVVATAVALGARMQSLARFDQDNCALPIAIRHVTKKEV
jgi:hypothetical protein